MFEFIQVLYVLLFAFSLLAIILLCVALYRVNRILKSTEEVGTAFSDTLTKLVPALINVASITAGISKIAEVLEKKHIFEKAKEDKK